MLVRPEPSPTKYPAVIVPLTLPAAALIPPEGEEAYAFIPNKMRRHRNDRVFFILSEFPDERLKSADKYAVLLRVQ